MIASGIPSSREGGPSLCFQKLSRPTVIVVRIVGAKAVLVHASDASKQINSCLEDALDSMPAGSVDVAPQLASILDCLVKYSGEIKGGSARGLLEAAVAASSSPEILRFIEVASVGSPCPVSGLGTGRSALAENMVVAPGQVDRHQPPGSMQNFRVRETSPETSRPAGCD